MKAKSFCDTSLNCGVQLLNEEQDVIRKKGEIAESLSLEETKISILKIEIHIGVSECLNKDPPITVFDGILLLDKHQSAPSGTVFSSATKQRSYRGPINQRRRIPSNGQQEPHQSGFYYL